MKSATPLLSKPLIFLLLTSLLIIPVSATYLQVQNGTTIRASNDTQYNQVDANWFNISTIIPPINVYGIIGLSINTSVNGDAQWKFYKNSIQIGVIGSQPDVAGWSVNTQYITTYLNDSDLITLSVYCGASCTFSENNFRLTYDYVGISNIGGSGYNWSANGTFDNATLDTFTNKLVFGNQLYSSGFNNISEIKNLSCDSGNWIVNNSRLERVPTGSHDGYCGFLWNYTSMQNLTNFNSLVKWHTESSNDTYPSYIWAVQNTSLTNKNYREFY